MKGYGLQDSCKNETEFLVGRYAGHSFSRAKIKDLMQAERAVDLFALYTAI